MIWTDASALSGYDRSTRRPSTLPASAALASPGEIDVARSATVVPAGTLRLDPSGSVIVTWLIGKSKVQSAKVQSRLAERCVASHFALRTLHVNGRRGWTRTTDLLRVREAL